MFNGVPDAANHPCQCMLLHFSRSSRTLICRQYKRSRKLSTEPLDEQKRGFLASLQAVILKKMKWEDSTDLDDTDDDDRAAFEVLRKASQLLRPLRALPNLRSEGTAFTHGLCTIHRPRLGRRGHSNARPTNTPTLCIGYCHQMERCGTCNLSHLHIRRNKQEFVHLTTSSRLILIELQVLRRVDLLSVKHLRFPKRDEKRSTTLTFP